MLIKYLEGRNKRIPIWRPTWATQQVPGQLHGKSLLQNKERTKQTKELKQQK